MAKYLSSTTRVHPDFPGKSLPCVEFPGNLAITQSRQGADLLANELNKLDNVRHALFSVLTDVKDMVAEGATAELIHLLPRMRSVLRYGVDAPLAEQADMPFPKTRERADLQIMAEGRVPGVDPEPKGEFVGKRVVLHSLMGTMPVGSEVKEESFELITCIHTGKLVPKI